MAPSTIRVDGEVITTFDDPSGIRGVHLNNRTGDHLDLNRVIGTTHGIRIDGGGNNHVSFNYVSASAVDDISQSTGVLMVNSTGDTSYYEGQLVENLAGRDEPVLSVNNNSRGSFIDMRARNLHPGRGALALQGGAAIAILKDVALEIVNDGGVAVENGGTTGGEVHAIGTVRSNGEPGAGLTYTGTNFEWSTPL